MIKRVTKKNEIWKSLDLSGMKRRDFFKLLGGGIFIFFQPWAPFDLFDLQTQQRRTLPTEFNAFIQITEGGMVNCYTGKIEMGQGAITSFAQVMADEIEIPFEKVKMVMGDTDLCPWDGGTSGSRTIRSFSPSMRLAAAEAKTVLMQMASDQLHVPVSQLEVKDGIISDINDTNRKVSYVDLAKGEKIEKHLDGKPVLKDYRKFRYAGKPSLHQDARVKVTGEAKYAAEIRPDGLLNARILRPPSHGAKLLKVDTRDAEKIKGIQVVHEGDFVAVLSNDRDMADQAIVKVKASFSSDEIKVDDMSIFDRILKADSSANILSSYGNIETGRKISDILTESEYDNSYVAHSPMEPHAATAVAEGDKITIWVSTQAPYRVQETIAREMNVPLENVRIITPFVGGGFGGKTPHQQAVEAAKLAKISGKPVLVAWMRQEEFFYDTFRPAAVVKITSGMDKSGRITLWDFNTYYAGSRGSETIYDVPNARITDYGRASVHPFATGAWRAPGNNSNTFARESPINIKACRAGMDPLPMRPERIIAALKKI